jgi:hypothetical protein
MLLRSNVCCDFDALTMSLAGANYICILPLQLIYVSALTAESTGNRRGRADR